jgi:hypothetical protein
MTADYLFIVKHGETKANERGIEAGPLDYPLTKKRALSHGDVITAMLEGVVERKVTTEKYFVLELILPH